jgi:hypothetical protein
MADDNIKQAAQEFLAAQFTEEGLTLEEKLNRDAAIALAPAVWKDVVKTISAMCGEWNSVTREESLICKETVLGDLRIRCTNRPHQLTFHFDSKRRCIRVENTAREEYEPKVLLMIQGYATDTGHSARLVRNEEPVNLEMLVVGQLRRLAGLSKNPKL